MLEAIARIDAHGDRIASDGARWVAVTGDWVTFWEGRESQGELPPAPATLHEVRFDGEEVLAAPERARLATREWEPLPPLRLAPGARLVTAAWTPDGVDLLAVLADPPSPASASPRQRVMLLDGATRDERARLWEDAEWMRVQSVAAGEHWLAAAALEARIWRRENLAPAGTVADRDRQVRRLVFSPAEDELAVTYADGRVALVDPATGELSAAWDAHADDAAAVAYHPSGELLATGGWDDRVVVWRRDGEQLGELAVAGHVNDLAFLKGDRLVVAHDGPGTVIAEVRS